LSREIFLCSELLPYLLTLGIEKKHKNIFGKMGSMRIREAKETGVQG
jgi:hypothetical protein